MYIAEPKRLLHEHPGGAGPGRIEAKPCDGIWGVCGFPHAFYDSCSAAVTLLRGGLPGADV